MNLVKIAWRNLWRSRSRTILTAFVVFFVVILSVLSTSQQYGMYDKMVENVIEFSGHIQIQDTNYVKDKSINDAFTANEALIADIEKTEHITEVSQRIESFSLASYGDKTKGVMVLGIEPEREKNISRLDNRLVKYKLAIDSSNYSSGVYQKLSELNNTSYVSEGSLRDRIETALGKDFFDQSVADELVEQSVVHSEYFNNGDNEVLVGEALGTYLGINLGDTLVMISQGYHGASAAALMVVKGYLKLPLVQMERNLVVMDVKTAQQFYSAYDLATTIMIKLDNHKKLNLVQKQLNNTIPDNLLAQTWEELQPETVQMIESDKAGGVFMKAIFYLIVGFIIFGTIMMMLTERKREFGILIAVGLQRGKLAIILLYETLFIAFLGSIFGFVLSYPITYIMHYNPIPLSGEMAEVMKDYGFEPVIYFSNNPDIFYKQAIIIFIVSVIIFLFPLSSLGKLNIIKSIRG